MLLYEETLGCHSYWLLVPHLQEWLILPESYVGGPIEVCGHGCEACGFRMENHDESIRYWNGGHLQCFFDIFTGVVRTRYFNSQTIANEHEGGWYKGLWVRGSPTCLAWGGQLCWAHGGTHNIRWACHGVIVACFAARSGNNAIVGLWYHGRRSRNHWRHRHHQARTVADRGLVVGRRAACTIGIAMVLLYALMRGLRYRSSKEAFWSPCVYLNK